MAAVISDDDALARLGIHPAAPFDWGDAPHMTVDGDAGPSRKRARTIAAPSGLEALIQMASDDNNERDEAEKGILRWLLREAGVDASSMLASSMLSSASASVKADPPAEEDVLRDVSIRGLSDRGVAENAVECRTSLFGSILRLFDAPKEGEDRGGGDEKKKGEGGGKEAKGGAASAAAAAAATPNVPEVNDPTIQPSPILSTSEIVRSVHLSARPGDVPAGMDSKEYTMAALLFLSGRVPFLHEDESAYRNKDVEGSREGWEQLRHALPILPLIKAVNPGAKLGLRWYGRVKPLAKLGGTERKEQPDSMDRDDGFRRKVLNLERMYCASLPFSSKVSVPTPTEASQPGAPRKRGGNDIPYAFQRYVPRRKVAPYIEGGAKEELTLMISGHMQQPQHTSGPKSRGAKPKGPAPVAPGGKSSTAPGKTAATGAGSTTSVSKPAVPAGANDATKEGAGGRQYIV